MQWFVRLQGKVLFEAILAVFLAVLIVTSFSYQETARLIPLLIGVPTLLLVLVLLAADAVPNFGKALAFTQRTGIAMGDTERKNVAQITAVAVEEHSEGFTVRSWRLFGWLAFLALLLHYVSYVISIPLFVLLFMIIEAKERWLIAILTSIGMALFVLVLFRLLLRATF